MCCSWGLFVPTYTHWANQLIAACSECTNAAVEEMHGDGEEAERTPISLNSDPDQWRIQPGLHVAQKPPPPTPPPPTLQK